MNSHLLPFPYNQSQPSTLLERVIVQPLSDVLFGRPKHSGPQKPSTAPIPIQDNAHALPPIRIICISDTHNATSPLPPGNILVHAGDLTAQGSFGEIQAQLRWLASQPYTHKIVIAGNHDILLDEASDMRFLTRGGRQRRGAGRNWIGPGSGILQDEAVTLELPPPEDEDPAQCAR